MRMASAPALRGWAKENPEMGLFTASEKFMGEQGAGE
jgi:hypothetical protein